jgi:hypothetical protein
MKSMNTYNSIYIKVLFIDSKSFLFLFIFIISSERMFVTARNSFFW